MTTSIVFGVGNSVPEKEVMFEVIRPNEARDDRAAADVTNKKVKLSQLIKEVKKTGSQSKKKIFKWTNKLITTLVKYHKQKKNKAIPSTKDKLLKSWNKTQNRPSPQVSPRNSVVEDESNEEEDTSLEQQEDGDEAGAEDLDNDADLEFGDTDNDEDKEGLGED